MSFSERFWWIRLLGAAGLALAGCAMLIVSFSLLIGDLLGSGNRIVWPLLCLAVGASLFIGAWTRLADASDARSRTLCRRRARAGEPDAIPPSRIDPDRTSAPDVAANPLVLTWPRRWYEDPIVVQLAYLAWAASVSWVLLAAVMRLFFSAVWVPGVLTALGATTALAASVLTRAIGGSFGKPRRLIATSAGVVWEPVVGRTRFVRWHGCRLLEVASIDGDTSWTRRGKLARRYTLFADRSSISWTESAPLRSSPSGDVAALLALVYTHTGLAPRTFDPVLRDGGKLPPGVVVDTIPHAPAPATGPGAYVLSTRHATSRRARIIAGLVGTLLTGGGVLAVLWSLDAMHVVAAPDLVRSAIHWLNAAFAFFLLFAGAVGGLMLVAALNPWARPHVFSVRADETGLTQRTSHIAWSAVAGLAHRRLDTNAFSTVSSAAEDTTIMWTERMPGHGVSPADATPVTPTELAAVVSARSGKPIQVVCPRRVA